MSETTLFVASDPGEAFEPLYPVGGLGDTTTVGAGLWSADPTGDGSSELPVAGLDLGFAYTDGSLTTPPAFVAYRGDALFDVGSDLWITDGTPLGTREIAANVVASVYGPALTVAGAPDFTSEGGQVFFAGTGATGLSVTDGATVATIGAGPADPGAFSPPRAPADLTALGSTILFAGTGDVLWASDGTASGTAPLADATGAAVDGPTDLTVLGDRALFAASDGDGGDALWVTDGTETGTARLAVAGAAADGSPQHGLSPHDITAIGDAATGDRALFVGDGATSGGSGLWVTDGTGAGTSQIADGPVDPSGLVSLGASAVFEASGADGAPALWASDGTEAGTREIAADLSVATIAAAGTRAVFTTGAATPDLYVTDGTAAGTAVLSVAGAAASGLDPADLTATGDGTVEFTGFDASGSLGLWVSDGTTAGTREILSGLPLVAVGPLDFVEVDRPALFFTALAASAGVAPFGSAIGVQPVGQTVTVTLSTNRAVTVDTGAGSPTLAFGNGEVGTFRPDLSGPDTLVFTATAAYGQETADLKVDGLSLNGATITDAAGDAIASTAIAGFSTADTGIAVVDPTPAPPTFIPPPTFTLPGGDGGLLTDIPAPVVQGTASPGATVRLFIGQTVLDTVADADGAWSATLPALAPGIDLVDAMTVSPNGATSTLNTLTAFEIATPAVDGTVTLDMTSAQFGFGGVHPTLQFMAGTAQVQLIDGVLSVGTDTDAAFVARLYQGLYGAVPDGAQLGVWTAHLAAGMSRNEVASAFLAAPASAPFRAMGEPDYVIRLFEGLLGHPPDAQQLAFYEGLLGRNVGKADILNGIASSPEAAAHLAPQTSDLFVPDDARATADALYTTALGRDPPIAEVTALAAELRAGVSIQDVAKGLLAAPEIAARYADATGAGFVTQLYGNALYRAPSASELAFQLGPSGVADATRRVGILVGIATSPEAAGHLSGPL